MKFTLFRKDQMNRGRSRGGGGSQFNRRPHNGPPRYPANYAVPPYRQQQMNNWNYDYQCINPQMGHPRIMNQNQGRWMGRRQFYPRDGRNFNPRYGNYPQYNQPPSQEEEPLQTYFYTSGISQPSKLSTKVFVSFQ